MKKTLSRLVVSTLMLSIWFTSQNSWAQSDPTGMRRITDTYAITNATVFTAPGKEGMKATVLMRNGIIAGMGANLSIPSEARVIAGDSLYIYPGFLAGNSDAGVTKPEDPERPKDFVSSNPPDEIAGITPWRSAVDQYSTSGSGVDDLRKAGFTVVQVSPDGGMIAGKSAIMVLGNPDHSNLIAENTALATSFRSARGMYPGTAAGVMAKFRDVYKNAELTKTHAAKYNSSTGARRPEITDTNQAMMDVISGEVPVLFSADDEFEIRRVLKLQKELGFKLILTDLENYADVIPEIKASGAGVLIKLEVPDDKASKKEMDDASEDAKMQLERVKQAYQEAVSQAAKLEEAGIPFAFSASDIKANDVMSALKTMMENGLSEAGAMAALTTNPANMLGLSKVAGTLAQGKMANMVIATGPLFEEDSQIKHVVVDGYIFDYETKSKKAKSANGASSDVQIEGVWDYETESPAGSGEGTITISKSGDEYEGTITYDDPSGSGKASAPISNIELNGNSLSFTFQVNAQGMSIDIEVSGDITGNTMDGSMSLGQFGSFPLTATLNPSQTTIK
ncbi:amidohydrolase family protein [Algoriphagus namhaensis]|uniref:Amidohydrolase family protein n=1 Tax=Algoriphagus namhaensis TaxID=915353 RepID=A0ABV8ATT4_9BACT